jgi:hypothetical protein
MSKYEKRKVARMRKASRFRRVIICILAAISLSGFIIMVNASKLPLLEEALSQLWLGTALIILPTIGMAFALEAIHVWENKI